MSLNLLSQGPTETQHKQEVCTCSCHMSSTIQVVVMGVKIMMKNMRSRGKAGLETCRKDSHLYYEMGNHLGKKVAPVSISPKGLSLVFKLG